MFKQCPLRLSHWKADCFQERLLFCAKKNTHGCDLVEWRQRVLVSGWGVMAAQIYRWSLKEMTEEFLTEILMQTLRGSFSSGIFIIHHSCVLQSFCKHWISEAELAAKGETDLGFCEPLMATFPSIHQYITLSYVHLRFKAPYVVHMVDSLTWNSQPTDTL